MTKRYPTVKQQEEALDEMKRILNRDVTTMTSDEAVDDATPELLERVVLFEGILNMLDILEEKVTAGVLLASKVIHYDGGVELIDTDLVEQAQTCLDLMVGKEK